LDNSPHVPFFAPIIDELEKRNYSVVITARDCFQVRELADLFHLQYKLIGRHSGKNKIRKMAGVFARAVELMFVALHEAPDLALAVCSRSQLVASTLLRIPSFFIGDYEHATGWVLIRPTWLMCPEVIPNSEIRMPSNRILKWPGIKEDVYVPRFSPDPNIRPLLGLREHDVVATLRPPANEAHYHSPHSDELFTATVEFLSKFPNIKLVVLPRNGNQELELRKRWPELFSNGTMRIPTRVVDGLNLIWNSDFVISGGGTMNREAAALGVPVYSVFRGKIGAVDQYLARRGRLVLLESVEDIQTKISIAQRNRPVRPQKQSETILRTIVRQITAVVDSKHSSPNPTRISI
jgi:predicted glycosyltransferase